MCVRSGSGGAYCSRSRCALVASATTYTRVRARARESAVYAHSRVNSDGPADQPGPFDGGAMCPVTRQCVRAFQVVRDVAGVELPALI